MKKIKNSLLFNYLHKNNIKFKSDLKLDEYVHDIKPILNATKNDLTFFSNIKYLKNLKQTKSKACIINKKFVKYLPNSCKPIIVDDPYYVLAILTGLFGDKNKKSSGIISKTANVSKEAKIDSKVQIDSFTNIDKNCHIMSGVIIGPNTTIGPNVIIKKNSIVHNNVSISNAIIEENCEIQSGAIIGGSGFGFDPKSKKKIIHHGNVLIGNHSTIGSNTTIDRAVFETTKIGEYSQIDNLVQIAHNVIIGKHAIIAAQVGIAGSTKIGDNVVIGGQAGISGHLILGKNVTIAAKSGVTKNLKDGMIVAGFPAKDIKLWKKELIKFKNLNDNT